MVLASEEEQRLRRVEQRVETVDGRVDDLYAMVGKLAVSELQHEQPKPETLAPEEHRVWLDQIPVKWIAIWICGIITLVLATAGFIKPELLTDLWHLLAGGAPAVPGPQ